MFQLEQEDELIISDDGSTDRTIGIIKSFEDKRIKLVYNEHNFIKQHRYCASHYLVTSNFENALRLAKGDYVFLSDQDDIWMPNKIAVMKSYLQKYMLVRCNCSIIDADGNVTKEKDYFYNPISRNVFMNIWRIPFRGCHIAFRKEVLEKALPFPNDCMMHDGWIGIVACAFFNNSICFVDEPLMAYRRHRENISAARGKSENPLWFRFAYRIKLCGQLLTRWVQFIVGINRR